VTTDEERLPKREGHLLLGVTVRTLGAWPAGWRLSGAHRDPRADPAVLEHTALTAEGAGLDFLYFGDWLATSAQFEHTEPYLLARVEPLAAIGFLAAVTERIGLIASVSSAFSEPFAAARSTASIDLLSGGRVGVCVTTGSEARAAGNFGRGTVHDDAARFAAAGEYIEILRGLWNSWHDDAIVADAATGRLIDAAALLATDFAGAHHSSRGPLNVVRSPQGQPPVAVVGGSLASRRLAARDADLLFANPRTLAEAVEQYAAVTGEVEALGRQAADLRIVTPILPIVAETREAAWELYDELVALVLLPGDGPDDAELPANRSLRTLSSVLGVPLAAAAFDDPVPTRTAARFGVLGAQLVETARSRSGRTVGGTRPVTYRHLLVAHAVTLPVLVGSAADVADHMELWFRSRAVDGFTVLTASSGEAGSASSNGIDAFVELVVPELRRRGLFRTNYAGSTLRDHLGLRAGAVPRLRAAPQTI
jgi:FMN-dependent oxidoreductase (nitrilotriacetate monooxygenase family)